MRFSDILCDWGSVEGEVGALEEDKEGKVMMMMEVGTVRALLVMQQIEVSGRRHLLLQSQMRATIRAKTIYNRDGAGQGRRHLLAT